MVAASCNGVDTGMASRGDMMGEAQNVMVNLVEGNSSNPPTTLPPGQEQELMTGRIGVCWRRGVAPRANIDER